MAVDFASEGCQWEIAECHEPGAGFADAELNIYCAEHLAIWRAEIERPAERAKPKLSPEVEAWYRRMTAAPSRDEGDMAHATQV